MAEDRPKVLPRGAEAGMLRLLGSLLLLASPHTGALFTAVLLLLPPYRGASTVMRKSRGALAWKPRPSTGSTVRARVAEKAGGARAGRARAERMPELVLKAKPEAKRAAGLALMTAKLTVPAGVRGSSASTTKRLRLATTEPGALLLLMLKLATAPVAGLTLKAGPRAGAVARAGLKRAGALQQGMKEGPPVKVVILPVAPLT
jgi:hypothetical protein